LILAGFVAAVAGAGWAYYRGQELAFEEAKREELKAIAALRVSQIWHWRQERLGGARALHQNVPLVEAVEHFLCSSNSDRSKASLSAWMEACREHSRFGRVLLLDPSLTVRLAVPADDGWVGPLAREFARATLATNQVLVSDLHLSQVSGRANMDLFVPLVGASETGARSGTAVAVLVLEVEPHDFLFPTLQTWPTSSQTAETLLLRREGDEVVILNDLRHRTNTAMELRFPIQANRDLVCVRAALGEEGVVTARDYRGREVLAAMLPVPGSPWTVVAKQDEAEIYALLRRQAWAIAATVAAIVLAAVLGLILLWRNREYQFSRSELASSRRAEESLRQAELRFRGFAAATFEGICVVARGRIVDANDQFAALFGYQREELLGKDALSLVPTEHRAALAHAVETGSDSVFEHTAMRKDGTTFMAEARGRAVQWEGRNVRIVAVRDITERRRLQAALEKRIVALTCPIDRTSEVGFTDLFNPNEIQKVQDAFAKAAGVASVITTPEGVPLTIPSNFCRLCNSVIRGTEKGRANCYRSDACIGKHNPSGPTIQPCLSGGLWDAGASITVGGRHVANWLVGQVRNEAQDEARMLEYAREIGADIEEFRQALREVPVMSRERFEWVAQAVFVLANELSLRAYQNSQQARLLSERQRAEAERERLLRELMRKNKELESVVYVSSHDLRSPLVNIQGFSHRLQSGCEQIQRLLAEPQAPRELKEAVMPIFENRVRPSLEFILSSVLKMDGLLNGLLRLSRLGRSALQIENLNMTGLARGAAEAMAFQFQQAGASVMIEELPAGRGDPVQISQVMSNLLDNALKYRDPNRPLSLRVRGKIQSTESVYCVEDNGSGIAPEHHEKIWEIFQRLDPNGTVKGEGLGLSIVRRILDRHDGRAWVESEPGRGSRFFFTLSAASVAASAILPT
jgi:PAS domain S-box-containing protein